MGFLHVPDSRGVCNGDNWWCDHYKTCNRSNSPKSFGSWLNYSATHHPGAILFLIMDLFLFFGVAALTVVQASQIDKGRPLPKFGEWDVNDPDSAEGFIVIFNKARDERKTGGNTPGPDTPSKDGTTFKHGACAASKPTSGPTALTSFKATQMLPCY